MMKVIETGKIRAEQLDRMLFGGYAERERSRIEATVRAIVSSVRREGDRALVRFTEKYDRVTLRPSQFRIGEKEIRSAHRSLSAGSLRALRRAHGKITAFHKKHLRRSWVSRSPGGSLLGQRLSPVERVGVYCPGGKALYPSSVLMNIVPAKVAGCREIIMVSPPSGDGGTIHPALLAAADIAGVTQVYRVGGAQAVAALAYGTKTLPRADKIVGPGNVYVTLAKRIVAGQVAIDMEAGPSEIMILADSTANPRHVAADILSQAEHDEMASAILVTTSGRLVGRVMKEIDLQVQRLDRQRIARNSLRRNGLAIVTKSMEEAVAIANRRAPEHLELLVRNADRVLKKIHHAGVVFLGDQTPNAVGDYLAGPNHVLPTGGRARFSSPLSAEDFRKATNVVRYSTKQLRAEADDIIAIAELEGLTAHANAIRVRLKK
jgi:histidinol dehydrogenase